MLIVGVGKKVGISVYEVHNSYGTSWGNRGFGFIECSAMVPLFYVHGTYLYKPRALSEYS